MDHLVGLKENVIIGKLIPAGAGINAYREIAETMVPDLEPKHPEYPEPVLNEEDLGDITQMEEDGTSPISLIDDAQSESEKIEVSNVGEAEE